MRNDPITAYELIKVHQRQLEAEARRYQSVQVVRAKTRGTSLKQKLTCALGSLALTALEITLTLYMPLANKMMWTSGLSLPSTKSLTNPSWKARDQVASN